MIAVSYFFAFLSICAVHRNLVEANEYVKDCAADWVRYGTTKCFKLFMNGKTINQTVAERQCISLGSHLASIHSDDERRFLKDLVLRDQPFDQLKTTWIGGRKIGTAQKPTFIWNDLTAFDYTAWWRGYPKSEIENAHLALETHKDYYNDQDFGTIWDATNGNERSENFICQKLLIPTCCNGCDMNNCNLNSENLSSGING